MISTSGSLTSSAYEPYALAELGALTSSRKAVARETEEEDAAAATTCWISLTSRVAGFVLCKDYIL